MGIRQLCVLVFEQIRWKIFILGTSFYSSGTLNCYIWAFVECKCNSIWANKLEELEFGYNWKAVRHSSPKSVLQRKFVVSFWVVDNWRALLFYVFWLRLSWTVVILEDRISQCYSNLDSFPIRLCVGVQNSFFWV